MSIIRTRKYHFRDSCAVPGFAHRPVEQTMRIALRSWSISCPQAERASCGSPALLPPGVFFSHSLLSITIICNPPSCPQKSIHKAEFRCVGGIYKTRYLCSQHISFGRYRLPLALAFLVVVERCPAHWVCPVIAHALSLPYRYAVSASALSFVIC